MTPEQLAAMAANALPSDPPPTEAEIDLVLARLDVAFGVGPSTIGETRKLLHSRYMIRMDLGQTLKSDDGHQPWLAGRREEIEPFFWQRYREMLLRNGWSPLVAATLDRSTDELLDLMGNPALAPAWKRRGLVVGDVQSGKTASYAAVICKAADAGYRMVILLAGTLENVRRQTQERLDAAFVGLDSRDFLTAGSIGRKTHVGVGLIDGHRDGIVFTSRDHDFRKNTASALNLSLESVKEPVLVVSKKNQSVLKRLAAWLRARNADSTGKIDVPLLLVDDEADNASINTKQGTAEATAINRSIRDLLSLFRRSSYIGFTATPFANIFIDPASTSEMLGDDLFPRDFIHVLEPPTNYRGMNDYFAVVDPERTSLDADCPPAAFIKTVDDDETWLPPTHKKDFVVEQLAETLRTALRCFLLATAIRDVRAASGATGRGGGSHRSMLVNVSRFTDVQNRIANVVHLELEDIRRAVRLHGAQSPGMAAAKSKEIARLESLFLAEFPNCGVDWTRVLSQLHASISPIVVRAVNQSTGSASLDYSPSASPRGLRVVAVGGNSLSRGLTLEGLSTSYFLRNAKAYDTLLQMGRWFGYRDGYDDLCRLWVTAEAEGWYRHVAEATGELKRDFARMRKRQATPMEFGLRVRTHPDTLLITARNKMASGINVFEETRDISLMGRGVESARLFADEQRNRQNLDRIDRFVAELVHTAGRPSPSPHGGAIRWTDVPGKLIAPLVEEFLVHPLNHDFQADSIAERIRDWAEQDTPQLARWTVALLTDGKGGTVGLASLPGQPINAKLRSVALRPKNALLISGRSARVGSLRDVWHGLAAGCELGGDATEDRYRQELLGPLLLIFLIKGLESPSGVAAPRTSYRDGLLLPALAMHFPGVPDPDAPRHLVRYRLNVIAQDELFGADLVDENDSDDADVDADD